MKTNQDDDRTLILKGHKIYFYEYGIITFLEPPLKKGYWLITKGAKGWKEISSKSAEAIFFLEEDHDYTLIYIGGKNENLTNSPRDCTSYRRANKRFDFPLHIIKQYTASITKKDVKR